MTRALILFTSLLLLTACSHRRDAEIRKNLPGTWQEDVLSTNDSDGKSTITIATSGDFVSQTFSSKGVHIFDTSGTFQVANGYLIETIKKVSLPAHVPFVTRGQIVQADAHEMVAIFDGGNGTKTTVTLKKDTE